MDRKLMALAALAVGLGACSDAPSGPGDAPAASREAAAPSGVRDVPAVRMDLPAQPRPWDASDDALSAAVAAQDGHAVVAFKERGSARAQAAAGARAGVSGATVHGALSMLRGRGVEIVEYYEAIGAAHVRMAPELAPELRRHPLVDYVEPRQRGEILGVRAASAAIGGFSTQLRSWNLDLIRAPRAHGIADGAGAKLLVIDTGHNRGHVDLPLVPLANCAGLYGGCDDGAPIPHGSHVTGIAVARNNTEGVLGVAYGVAAGDVYEYGACDSGTGFCSTTEVTAGIDWAVGRADVVNLSLRQPYDLAQSNAVAQAWASGIVIVAAAGNNQGNTEVYPARYSNVVGVSGVQRDESFASTSPATCNGASSNYGAHVDVSAPFWAPSTVPGGYGDEVQGWCGTSMASPHVAGVALLLRAYRPGWTNQQIVDRILNTAQDRGAAGWDQFFGRGIVDAHAALAELSVGINGPDFVGSTCWQESWTSTVSGGSGSYTYRWEAGDGRGLWTVVGTGSTLTYADCGSGYLRLTVTSGSQAGAAERFIMTD